VFGQSICSFGHSSGPLAGELVNVLGVALAGWHSGLWWGMVAAGAVGGLIFRLQALSRAARESKNPN
jgi:hypothetical protein